MHNYTCVHAVSREGGCGRRCGKTPAQSDCEFKVWLQVPEPPHTKVVQWTMCDRKAAVARPWRVPKDTHLLDAFTGGLWLQARTCTQ